MARSNHLEIYKSAYNAFILVNECVILLPRDYKFTIGKEMRRSMLKVFKLIAKANSTADRERLLEKVIHRTDEVMLLLRLVNEAGKVSRDRYIHLCEILESINRQAAGWRKYKPANK